MIEGIEFLEKKVKRVSDGAILTCINPDPELGYFKSLSLLKEHGYQITSLINDEMTLMYPSLYVSLTEDIIKNRLSSENFQDYFEKLSIKDKESILDVLVDNRNTKLAHIVY